MWTVKSNPCCLISSWKLRLSILIVVNIILWELSYPSQLACEKLNLLPFPPPFQTSDAEGKLEDACEGFLQERLPEDAGSGIQVSGKCVLSFEGTSEWGRQSLVALTFCQQHSCQKAGAWFFRVTWSLTPYYFSESSGHSGFWKMRLGHCSHWNTVECDDYVLAIFQLKNQNLFATVLFLP